MVNKSFFDEKAFYPKNDEVNSPKHYKQGKRETIEVIQDYMTSDEFVGYLKGNILKYVGRFKFKGKPLQDLEKAEWYLNKLIKEVKTWEQSKKQL